MSNRPVEEVLSFQDVDFSYGGPMVLRGVNLSIPGGSLTGIVGPNGGGKTTLLRLALGLLEPIRGQIRVLGRGPKEARSEVGYVPQHFRFDRQFPVSAMDVALMGRLRTFRGWQRYSRQDREMALESLARVEMSGLARRPFGDLSGGQQQRVLVARALAAKPRLLLLDEPTANVDPSTQRGIYELMQRLALDVSVVMVTHDMNFVSSTLSHVVCVNGSVDVHPTAQVPDALASHVHGPGIRFVRHDKSLVKEEPHDVP